jgi:hypothetical protein
MMPASRNPANISGKMVIISNLIQVQKAIRRVDHDQPGLQVDLPADLPAEGDENLLTAFGPDHQQVAAGRGLDIVHPADLAASHSHDPAAQDLVVVEGVSLQGLELLLRDQNLRPGQGFGLGYGLDPFELEDEEVFKGPQVFDPILDRGLELL